MRASDFRHSAWKKLHKKWGTVAVVYLIYSSLLIVSSFLSVAIIGLVMLVLVIGPLTCGYHNITLKVVRNQEIDIAVLFSRFKDSTSSFILYMTNNILIFLWTLLLIIPGIIKSLSYSMSYYILLDNPDLTANEARKKSVNLMKGNKSRLFRLQLSFLGWIFLSMLTLFILIYWIQPYMQTAMAEFYENLVAKNNIGVSRTKEKRSDLKNKEELDILIDSGIIVDQTYSEDYYDGANNSSIDEKRKELLILYEAGIISDKEYQAEMEK